LAKRATSNGEMAAWPCVFPAQNGRWTKYWSSGHFLVRVTLIHTTCVIVLFALTQCHKTPPFAGATQMVVCSCSLPVLDFYTNYNSNLRVTACLPSGKTCYFVNNGRAALNWNPY
jgi:hypothetical protein